jgi:outer membrane immunogenic protein
MRSVLALVLALGVVPAAQAADLFDLPILRGSSGSELGPPRYQSWDGFYAGLQAGYQAASMDFGGSTSDQIAYILRNTTIENEAHVSSWTVLPATATSGTSFGGFVGYNMQWESAILGLELNYDRSSLKGQASDSIARSFTTSTGYFYNVLVSSQASLRVQDYVTARARAGWSGGWFMPYMFAAIAVARVDVLRSATVTTNAIDVTGVGRPDLASGPTTQTDRKDGAFAYGYAIGLGADMALTGNLFVRAEWEYLKLTYSGGYEADINTLRGGLGVRF